LKESDSSLKNLLKYSQLYEAGSRDKEFSHFQSFVYNFKKRDVSKAVFYLEQIFRSSPKRDYSNLAFSAVKIMLDNIPATADKSSILKDLFAAERILKETSISPESVLVPLVVKAFSGRF